MFGLGCGRNLGLFDQIAIHVSGTKPTLLVYSHTLQVAIELFPYMIIHLVFLLGPLFESVYASVVMIYDTFKL